jgi:hypothetical protein
MNAVPRLLTALVTAALAGGLAGPAFAADTVTVDAEVSIVAPCLTVSTTSVDFGANLPSVGTDANRSLRAFSYASCSGLSEKVFGRGTDANGPTSTWSLLYVPESCSIRGLNNFSLYGQGFTDGRTYFSYPLTTTDQEVETVGPGVAGSTSELVLWMPCVGSDGVGETMSFQIVFTASF